MTIKVKLDNIDETLQLRMHTLSFLIISHVLCCHACVVSLAHLKLTEACHGSRHSIKMVVWEIMYVPVEYVVRIRDLK